MSQTAQLIVYITALVVVALVSAIITPVMTYLLNERALDKQTATLQRGQDQIVSKVEATHDLVNGQSELLRAQREAKGYAAGAADAKDAAQLADELSEQKQLTDERNGTTNP